MNFHKGFRHCWANYSLICHQLEGRRPIKNKHFEDLNQFHKEFYNKEEDVSTVADLLIYRTKATVENRWSCFSLKPVENILYDSNAQIHRIYRHMRWALLQ